MRFAPGADWQEVSASISVITVELRPREPLFWVVVVFFKALLTVKEGEEHNCGGEMDWYLDK